MPTSRRQTLPNKINIQKFRSQPARLDIVELQFEFPADQEETLGLLSITVNPEKLNFSFFEDDGITEALSNPNIQITKKQSLVINKSVDLANKFDNVDDPIFDLDDARPSINTVKTSKNNPKASVVLSRINIKNTKTKYGVKNGS